MAEKCKQATQKTEKIISVLAGFFRFSMYIFYIYAFWVGAYFMKIKEENYGYGKPYDVGTLILIQFAMMMGMMNLMSLNPNIQALSKALVVGKKVFDVIDRNPEIKDYEGTDESLRKTSFEIT